MPLHYGVVFSLDCFVCYSLLLMLSSFCHDAGKAKSHQSPQLGKTSTFLFKNLTDGHKIFHIIVIIEIG